MKGNLFGTDGIRSAAGAYPLDEPSLVRLGAAIASLLPRARVLIARDTRESGPVIEAQLAHGLGRGGARVFSAGVLPTPGLAFLARELGYDLGIMVSASHNPFGDNGIKIFDRRGEKIPARLEQRISEGVRPGRRLPRAAPRSVAAVSADAYGDFLARSGKDLSAPASEAPRRRGAELAVDCANGAAYRAAPLLFARLGVDAAVAHARPNGRNINAGCGSTFPTALQGLVEASRAGLGLALDGDGDRAIFADARGRILDGDHALFLIARHLRRTEPRFNRVVVGTVMSNLGLERALGRLGIGFRRAAVGDKHVQRLMKRCGAILGGEPSGHVILRHRQTTGDGLLTALSFMQALRYFGCDAAAVFDELPLFPQETLSIRVRRRKDLRGWKALQEAASRFSSRHGRNARLLVRYSGTEAKIRIMIEARDRETISAHLPIFQSLVQNEIGE
jgi:phosphoglucosamine mutase